MGFSKPEQVFDLVASSPIAASRKNREAWLGLFDENARIEDPVGSVPFSAAESFRGLDVFYDIFIAHSDIHFVPHSDFICDCHVVRDGDIIVEIADSQQLEIPVFLRYEVSDESKISSLRAHWRPTPAAIRAVGCRPSGLKYLVSIGRKLYNATGLRGVRGFAQAAFPAALGGRITLHRLKTYLETGRYSEAVSLFSFFEGNEVVFYSDTIEIHPAGYLTMGKLKITAVDKLIDGGHVLSFRCETQHEGQRRSGVAFLTFSAAGFRIRKFELFLGDG
jgi:hypothetical protein